MKGALVESDQPRIRVQDTGQTLQEDRFAGSAGAQHGENHASGHPEVDALQHTAAVEALPQIFDMKDEILMGGIHDQIKKELMM
jgi:hypothetical protein